MTSTLTVLVVLELGAAVGEQVARNLWLWLVVVIVDYDVGGDAKGLLDSIKDENGGL